MKIIKPRNSKFNKWFLARNPFVHIDDKGELIMRHNREWGVGELRYYELYEAYMLGKGEKDHGL